MNEAAVAVTILLHPDRTRIGERCSLSKAGEDLLPATVRASTHGLLVEPRCHLKIDGTPIPQSCRIEPVDLDRGAILEIEDHTVLMVHRVDAVARRSGPDLGIIGWSDGIARVRREISRISGEEVSILLRGETGTGKELAALALHAASERQNRELVAVNLAALSASVATSELFGHQRGAFTGATEERAGYFQRAHRGTLFLDEIGEASLEVQVLLLRALETKKVQPVGACAEQEVDVRLITATDLDLEGAVAAGKFRAALYYRLAGYEIHLPALRERREDIICLLNYFSPGLNLSASAVTKLCLYEWPGNVRQLRNVARRLIMAEDERGRMQVIDSLPRVTGDRAEHLGPSRMRKPSQVARHEVFEAMRRNAWRIERAASELGVSRASMYRLIAAHPELRAAKDVTREELLLSHRETGGRLEAMSERLRISIPALRGRLTDLKSTGT
jgi:two-component system nitrogen regulation response regulator GlnG